MINIHFEDPENLITSRQFIKDVVAFTYLKLNLLDVEITIEIVSNERIRQLNEKYMGTNSETDVLSFNLGFQNPESGREYLGDVVISGEKTEEQAREIGHTVEKEMAILITHGILHLVGYDDQDITDKAVMFALQDKITQDFFKVEGNE